MTYERHSDVRFRERKERHQEIEARKRAIRRERQLDVAIAVVGFIFCLLAAITLLVTVIFFGSQHACKERAQTMGVEHEFTFWGGCFFDTENGFIPEDQIRWTEDGNVVREGQS